MKLVSHISDDDSEMEVAKILYFECMHGAVVNEIRLI
jgi:hypothetical protein